MRTDSLSSIDIFPQVYLLSPPLYTNRPLARLKIGEYSGCTGELWAGVGCYYARGYTANTCPGGNPDHFRGTLRIGYSRMSLISTIACQINQATSAGFGGEGGGNWEEAVRDWKTLVGMEAGSVGERANTKGATGAGRVAGCVAVARQRHLSLKSRDTRSQVLLKRTVHIIEYCSNDW